MARAIIVFAKAPRPGRVKTRLVPPLTAEQASELHCAFTSDLLERLAVLDARLELHTDVATDAWEAQALQSGATLGDRILHASGCALASGCDRVAVLGSDAPHLPLAHVRSLLDSGADLTFGPAEDGGFWGIALRLTSPRLFEGVPWSSAGTLASAVRAAAACGFSVELAASWWDVDTPADLERLKRTPDLPPRTRALLVDL